MSLRTAEEILKQNYLKQISCENNEFVIDEFDEGVKSGRYDYAILAINQARKEVLTEAANVVKTYKVGNSGSWYDAAVDKSTITDLIKLIK